MDKSDYKDYERRSRLYYNAFEEYDSLNKTYRKFYNASNALKKRGRFLTFTSTLFGGILLFIIGTVIVRGGPSWGTELALGISIIVAGLSFVNAVDSPQQMSNVTYNSGQTLQRVFLEFHYFVTVQLPDPDEDIEELKEKYDRLLEKKHIVNETTPSIGNKWYGRIPEKHMNWEPKPLVDVTGEDGEFRDRDQEENSKPKKVQQVWNQLLAPFSWIKREMGY